MSYLDNERIARKWFEVMWSTPTPDHIIDEIVHPDYGYGDNTAKKKGPAQMRVEIKESRSAFPDWKCDIVEMAALSDRVWVRYKGKVTQKGPFLGFAPTGETAEYEGVSILYIKDGKVISQWGITPLYDLLTGLGVVPPLFALKDHLRWLD